MRGTVICVLLSALGLAHSYVAPAVLSRHGAYRRGSAASALSRPLARRSSSRVPAAARSSTGARSVATTATGSISMKVFDWKRRTDTYEEVTEFMLHNLKPAPGSAHRKIRKCRGMGSGKGGPGGFGMRGQNSRGGRPTRPGFEGGQTPLYRRIPKLRGKPMGAGHNHNDYGLIKLDYLNKVEDNSEVSYEILMGAGAMTKVKPDLVKVVGGGALLRKGLVVKAHAFTASARQAITDAGGTCVEIPSYGISSKTNEEAAAPAEEAAVEA
ncbi:ribosomal protein L18e/L15P, partial [Pavlovales sp. CCMP2436]